MDKRKTRSRSAAKPNHRAFTRIFYSTAHVVMETRRRRATIRATGTQLSNPLHHLFHSLSPYNLAGEKPVARIPAGQTFQPIDRPKIRPFTQ